MNERYARLLKRYDEGDLSYEEFSALAKRIPLEKAQMRPGER